MRVWWVFGAVLGCVWVAFGASAQSHAEFHAKLKVAGIATPVDLRQSGAKMRVDANGLSYIADRDKGVLINLITTGLSKVALVFPLDRGEAVLPLPLDLTVMTASAVVKPVGASLVGGKSCRLMEFSGYLNQSGMICVNSDNVILQMTKQGRNEPLFQVTELTMGPQDAQWFRTPPDYQVAVVPGLGGASAAPSVTPVDSGQPMPGGTVPLRQNGH